MPYSSMSQACRSFQQSLYDWQLLPVLAVDCSGRRHVRHARALDRLPWAAVPFIMSRHGERSA